MGYNCSLRDRKLGRTYEKFDGSDKTTNILLENLRETYPTLNIIGFRLLGSRDGYSFFSRTFEYDQEPMEKAQKAYRKDKYVAITHTGYHKLFVMPSNNQSIQKNYGMTSRKVLHVQRLLGHSKRCSRTKSLIRKCTTHS